jgi:hypothetical protein
MKSASRTGDRRNISISKTQAVAEQDAKRFAREEQDKLDSQ